MAERTVKHAEKIILANGGKKVTENGGEYYIINTNAEYRVPLELPNGRLPVIIMGKEVDHLIPVSGNNPSCKWSQISGKLPQGLTFRNGKISGIPNKTPYFTSITELSVHRPQPGIEKYFKK